MRTANPYLVLARALWARGEDGEVIARELAQAFEQIVKEASKDLDPCKEFVRFMSEQKEPAE